MDSLPPVPSPGPQERRPNPFANPALIEHPYGVPRAPRPHTGQLFLALGVLLVDGGMLVDIGTGAPLVRWEVGGGVALALLLALSLLVRAWRAREEE